MSRSFAVRVALVVFVLAWILGPSELRSLVPLLLVFLVALGLEVNFLVGALRSGAARRPDRLPQEVDRDRYGFEREPDELVVVEDGDSEVWLAVSDEDEEAEPEDDDEDETSTRTTSPSLARSSRPSAASPSASASSRHSWL